MNLAKALNELFQPASVGYRHLRHFDATFEDASLHVHADVADDGFTVELEEIWDRDPAVFHGFIAAR